MRPPVSWIIVGAVLVVGLFAALDALRSLGDESATTEANANAATTDSAPTPDRLPRRGVVTERIRAEGSPENQTVTESGITTRAYVVCDGTPLRMQERPPAPSPYQLAAREGALPPVAGRRY